MDSEFENRIKTHSLEELYDIRDHIDLNKYPERYAAVLARIDDLEPPNRSKIEANTTQPNLRNEIAFADYLIGGCLTDLFFGGGVIVLGCVLLFSISQNVVSWIVNFPLVGLLILILFILLVFLMTSIRIIPKYVRHVVFRLGKFLGVRGPGIVWIIPIIDRSVLIDIREQLRNVTIKATTKEGTPVTVRISLYYKINDPYTALVEKAKTAIIDAVINETEIAVRNLSTMDVLDKARLSDELKDRQRIMGRRHGTDITNIEVREVQTGTS